MNRRLPLHPVKRSTNQRKREFRIRNFDQCAIGKLLTLRNDQTRRLTRKGGRKNLFIIDVRNLALTSVIQIGNPFYLCFCVTHNAATNVLSKVLYSHPVSYTHLTLPTSDLV